MNFLNKNYEEFYFKKDNPWNYNYKNEILYLKKNTSIDNFKGTLLDVGCGDGFFSNLLSEFKDENKKKKFIVTGSDLCIEAIKKCKNKYKNINFICENTLENKKKYDILFCRAPQFLDIDSNSKDFLYLISKLIKKTNKYLLFIRSVKPNKEEKYFKYNIVPGKCWNHKKEKIYKIFSNFGKCNVKYVNNMLIAELFINH